MILNTDIAKKPTLKKHFFQLAIIENGVLKRPCKIWAPYGGHCVEKSLAPKSKYVDTPKSGSIKCLGRTILMV